MSGKTACGAMLGVVLLLVFLTGIVNSSDLRIVNVTFTDGPALVLLAYKQGDVAFVVKHTKNKKKGCISWARMSWTLWSWTTMRKLSCGCTL